MIMLKIVILQAWDNNHQPENKMYSRFKDIQKK